MNIKIKDQKSKIKNKEETISSVVKNSSTTPPKSSKQPQTMEELLSQTGYVIKGFKKGEVLEGKITRVTPKEILIDIGGKTEGVVIDRELESYRETLQTLKPGDKVTAQVIVAENDRGQAVLSLRQSIFEKRWKELSDHQKSGESVDVVLKDAVRGGMLVEYSGLRGYIPQSQFDGSLNKQLDKIVGRRMHVKVMEVDQPSNRLIFSQRAVVEGEALLKQKELLSTITIGDTVESTVTGIVPFGAFAKFTVEKEGVKHEIEGLIHISEIAWEKVENPGEYLKQGDSVKVKIIGIDEGSGKVTLSLKQLLPDPWEHVLDMFEKDSQVKGKVSRVSPYGVFVTLSPGVDGLIHVSKIAPGEEPKVGDEVTVTIEDIQPDKRKIGLSMSLTEKPIGYR
ncbi:S1 RNA-binding domain-containing protein [Patescibacteria group bacterium]|nr:S1 RNA-binding domain-containing protein [Patescibacteria group bacterium]